MNRSTAFIHIPFLVNTLSLDDFGNFSLVQAIGQLLIPVLIVSSTAGVVRELSKGIKESYSVYATFSSVALITNCVCLILIVGVEHIFFYSVCLGAANGLNELNLAWFRVNNKYLLFFSSTALKIFSLLGLYSLTLFYQLDLVELLRAQFIIVLFISLVFNASQIKKSSYGINTQLAKKIISYTIMIIPHGVSLWALSSSDRVIIKIFLSDEELGLYSLSYSIGMLLSFINSGLSSTFPQLISKNYDEWDHVKMNRRVLKGYSITSILLFVLILIGIQIDKTYFHVLNYYSREQIIILTLVFSGIYCLGNYTYFSYFLVHKKKTNKLAKTTLTAAFINITLTVILVQYIGIIGAAISTSITYVSYLAMIYSVACKTEPRLIASRNSLLTTVGLVMLILALVSVSYINLLY